MLVSELKKLLKKYNEEELRLLILEMYKAMPKKLREDNDIDALLQDVQAYLGKKKNEKKQAKQIDIQELKLEIHQFIEHAFNQYYMAPNNVIRKSERPKWRFKVKAYIKSLQSVSVEGEGGRTATILLEQLYKMLSYACGYYIFNTDNPFRSVGIEQTMFLDMVLKRKLSSGISPEVVKPAVALVIDSIVDRETLHSELIIILVKNLKSPDAKEIAIEQCVALKAELASSKTKTDKKSWLSVSSIYERREKNNNLVEMVFRLYMALGEYEKAIKYYHENYEERESEISLYVLLRMLLGYELKEYWLREYDEAVQRGVKPRDVLQRTYKYIQENDSLPDYFIYN